MLSKFWNILSLIMLDNFVMENSVDPDQLVSEKPADLELHSFSKQNISRFRMIRPEFFQ